MKVVYYEDCVTKEITRCIELPCWFEKSEVLQSLKEYNSNENKTCNAVLTEIEDGSLAEFLFKKAEYKGELISDLLRGAKKVYDCAKRLAKIEEIDFKNI